MRKFRRKTAHFSFAVWDVMDKNTAGKDGDCGVAPHVPAELVFAFDRLNDINVSTLLDGAGLADSQSAPFSWSL